MSDTETNQAEETTQASSRPRRERKGRADAKKNDTTDSTATAVVTVDTEETVRNRKSTETTFQKQNFILELLEKEGELSINSLMDATYKQFGTRVAFDKAKEAKSAWQNGTEIKKRDGRRERRGRNMRRHDSQMTMVAVVEDAVVQQTYLCADDQAVIHQATKLAAEGTPTDNIQIYVRYSASAEVSFG